MLDLKYHFGVHEYESEEVPGKNLMVTKRAIVIKDDHGIIVPGSATGLELYVVPYLGTGRLIRKTATKQQLLFVTKALNYWVREYAIMSLREITLRMVHAFFDYYRKTPKRSDSETYVKQETLDKCVGTVCSFLANVADRDINMAVRSEDLMVQAGTTERNKRGSLYIPIIRKVAVQSYSKHILRELPERAAQILMKIIKQRDPMIFFACVLMRYAGLRGAEAMNVRQPTSPLSKRPGLKVNSNNGILQSIEIDLSREFRLRSDNVGVGKIKRVTNRMTEVYPSNLEIVYNAYLDHMELLKSVPNIEKEFMPMFVCRNGKAMTVQCFSARFRKIVKDAFVPVLLNNSELSYLGKLILDCGFGPHVFRHLFTVDLVLETDDAAQVQLYRGDSSMTSANAYIMGKSEISKALREKHTYVFTRAMAGMNIK